MSPSEFDLRAALRAGEGDGVDADRVIGRAVAARRARRERLVRSGSVAAVVAVVAGLSIAGGFALNGGSTHSAATAGSAATSSSRSVAGPAHSAAAAGPSAAGSAGRASTAPATGAAPAVAPAAPGPLHDAAEIPCPAELPAVSPEGAGSGPMFSGPVEAIKVCVYSTGTRSPVPALGGTGTVNTIFTGASATTIAASIDSAAGSPEEQPCPMYRLALTRTLAIIGVSPGGKAMAPITVEVGQNPCNLPITNGRAVRYIWVPPSVMIPFVARVSVGPDMARVSADATPIQPPKANGSPVH